MDVRHLRVFLTVAEELHFGRSARRLAVAQSAVSQTIRSLEEEIGAPVFDRSRKRVALTPAGEALIAPSRLVIEQLERVKASARSAAAGDVGDLRLRCTMMSTLTNLPDVVRRYQRAYPRVRLHIASSGSEEQLAALSDGRCDIAFISRRSARAHTERDTSLAALALVPSPLAVTMHRRHRFARRRSVQLRELAGEPLVFLRRADEPRVHEAFRRRCEAEGFEPRIVVEVDDLESVLGFVAAGVGLACVPSAVRALRFPGVKVCALTPEIATGIWAVWKRSDVSATARRFLSLLQEHRASPA